jgi:hypothetical protein
MINQLSTQKHEIKGGFRNGRNTFKRNIISTVNDAVSNHYKLITNREFRSMQEKIIKK